MKVLFVCSGNTCRSPLAAAIARREAAARGLTDVAVESAGASAWDGAPASDGAMLVAMENGLDVGSHKARLLTRDIVRDANLILAMGEHHRDHVESLGAGDRVHLLASYATNGADEVAVSDPFGGDLETYRATFQELEGYIRRAFDRIVAERRSDAA